MNTREKKNLERWKILRDVNNPSYMDILRHQSIAFYLIGLVGVILCVYAIHYFGLLSMPSGVIYGGFAAFMGNLESKRKNLKIELKYLDWSKINDTDD